MKRLEIYFDSFYTEKMKEELREYGIEQYFIVPTIHSSWSKDFKHFNTHVLLGTDSILITYLEDRHAEEILRIIKIMKIDLGRGISMGAVMLSVDDIIL
ncbi:PG0541 family transporter-associated protein [Leptotrichia sp. HSP-334]|uniref:PG0541 family transporter-associated protein n=1 Tax=Leptotrichia rugosa TaxID=3239302 RepID=A0AB39VFS0_9FUSO